MRRMLPSLLCAALLFLSACGASEEEKVHHTLRQREEAFRKKDLSLYVSCISPSYQDKNEDFSRLKGRIEGYFNVFDRIEYTSWDRSVRIDGEDAQVLQEFNLEVDKGGKRNRYSGKEVLYLRREGKEWKIIRGL